MTTNYIDAVDEMYGRFKTTLDAVAPGIVGNPNNVVVRYMGRDTSIVPPLDKFSVEVSQITATDRQTAFGVGSRLYTTTGTLFFKLFVPQVGTGNYKKGRQLADALKKGFRTGQIASSVWYRNARVQELLPEKGAYRFNVSIDYTYDERQ